MRPQTSALLAAAAAAAAWLLYKKKKKRRVVITGCCGNLGRKLGAYLQERGVEVVGIEHPDYCAKGSEPPCDCVVQADAQQPLDRSVLAGADAVALLSSMLDLNPAKRITAKDALAHPFFEPMPREWRELDGKPLEQYATEPMSKMTMHFESGGPTGRAELTSGELRRLIVAEADLYHK